MKRKWNHPIRPFINLLGKRIESRRFSEPPVFIGGAGRSGTTLLLSLMSAHPKLFCHPEEIGIFIEYKRKKNGKIHLWRLYRHYRSLILNPIPEHASRWCEKTPRNIHYVEEIDEYFKGEFKFIQIFRDGRDVILSKHPTNQDRYWVSPQRWIRDVNIGIKYLDDPRVHSIHYEDLIGDTEKVVRGICAYLDLEYTEEMTNWHAHARVSENRALYGSIQKISDKSIGKWKASEFQARAAELTDNPEGLMLLRKLGYVED